MSTKRKTKRSRNWTNEETNLYAKVLADESDDFCRNLEELALKKAANNLVFEAISLKFDQKLKDDEFVKKNKANFTDKDGNVIESEALDTSIKKLRRKYQTLKTDWRKIDDVIKKGSGVSPIKEPEWYKILNPIFSETNATLELTNSPDDISFSLDDATHVDDDNDDHDDEDGSSSLSESDEDENEEQPNDKKGKKQKIDEKEKTVVDPHKKRKIIRSQLQGLDRMAKGMGEMAAAQIKKTKMMIDADQKRDQLFLQHKADEAQKNREHELMLARIMMASQSAPQHMFHPRNTYSHIQNSAISYENGNVSTASSPEQTISQGPFMPWPNMS